MPIPKIIHYCWFGDAPLPNQYAEYIEGWKRICPDYTIQKWDATNYDVSKSKYTLYAFEQKKWAFLSDYARLDIIYQNGGIYLDVDVELLKRFDDLLDKGTFFGMERDFDRKLFVNTGLGFGSEKNSIILRELMSLYDEYFENNGFHEIPCPIFQKPIFEKHGFKQKNRIQVYDELTIFPTENFSPKDCFGKTRITNNTISIHQYAALWNEGNGKTSNALLYRKCVYYFGRTMGEYIYQAIKRMKRKEQ